MKEEKENTVSRVFKYTRFDKLKLMHCPLCSPHKGCNSRNKHFSNSWKDQSKKRKQWVRNENQRLRKEEEGT